ncbi:FAD-binding domain-containing protein, partial [Francisella tularensis]|uniref:FAD-binding domain-containing protein n=1 Tax=Francisella tularensis TaxID=263 RepID=UPI002381BC8B
GLNFRMRAMLMSFASYHLWLDWRVTSLYLAGLFTDYVPGIHYSQVQMQSGTTGIISIRIYNPSKQSIDQYPNGEFIRRWLPELENV